MEIVGKQLTPSTELDLRKKFPGHTWCRECMSKGRMNSRLKVRGIGPYGTHPAFVCQTCGMIYDPLGQEYDATVGKRIDGMMQGVERVHQKMQNRGFI